MWNIADVQQFMAKIEEEIAEIRVIHLLNNLSIHEIMMPVTT